MKKLLLFLTLLILGMSANAQFSPSNNLNYIKLLKTPPSGLPKDSVLVFDSSDSFVKMIPKSEVTEGKEDVINKISVISEYSETLYPNEKAVHDGLNMKLNISDLPTNLTLYPTTAVSDIPGYVKMVTDIHDADYNTVAVDVSTPTINTTSQLISQRISAPGVLIGQPGVFNITTFGNIRRLSGTGTATFYFEVYHRDLAGAETLICTSGISAVVSLSTYVEFTASGVWDNGDFLATDRIVIKTYANRIPGNSDPVYQLQFGGSTPIRTLLPVPFSVVDAGYELKTNKQNSLAVDITNLKYTTVTAVNTGLSSKVDKVINTKSTTPIIGGALNARMCVSNGMLYVTEYTNNKIGVFSLENPMSPTKIYDFAVGSAPRHVVVSGRNLFVACHDANKIEIYDIQNPESALKIGEIPTGSQPKMFELIGSEIFVACFGSSKVEKYKIFMPDASLSNFSYYKVGEVSVGAGPLALSYNGDGILAVCGNGSNLITILSTDDLNVADQTAFGGAGHGTCAWFNKTQLLVTDWTTESLLSIDYSNLSTPILSSSITVSENPEQIEIVGNIAYIPSLRIGVSPSYLDFIDLSNAKLPVKIKSETLTVNAAGFTAPYTDGVNTYLYVDGHEAPFNIDAIKIQNGNFHRFENLMEDVKYINRLGVANLTTNTVDEAKKYANITNPYTISAIDNVTRLTTGTTTLPNPNTIRDGKVITISNTSNAGNVTVLNPFSGTPSLTLFPYESIILQAAKSGASYAWDAVGGRRNFPTIFDSGSNVGIGTLTPSSYLNYRFLALNGADGSVLQLRKGDVTFAEIGGDGVFVNYDTFGGAYSKFSIGGVEKLRIDASSVTIEQKLKALCPIYANDAAADADATLLSGQFYKLTGSRIVYQKP